MTDPKTDIILWIGSKHSGKTTTAMKLRQRVRSEGFTVAGVLCPSVYVNNTLTGFDILDAANDERIPLARRKAMKNDKSAEMIGPFAFSKEGLEFGYNILQSPKTHRAHLIFLDEFGPLELKGKGWRRAFENLLGYAQGILLLVVREYLLEQVRQLYCHKLCTVVHALESETIETVINLLKQNSQSVDF